jgi:hypothetical protein
LSSAQHRLAHDALREPVHEGLDRKAPLRRGGDHREVAQPFQRHRERSRDRGGREREDVHLGAQLLQLFLLPHAEAMLLVDDHEAEVP